MFTHRDLPPIPDIDIRFVQGDVRPVYDEMVAALPGKNVWVVGGGDLVGQFDDAGLLDEIWLGLHARRARRRCPAAAAPDHLRADEHPPGRPATANASG